MGGNSGAAAVEAVGEVTCAAFARRPVIRQPVRTGVVRARTGGASANAPCAGRCHIGGVAGAEPVQGLLAGVNPLQIFALQSVITAAHYEGGWGFPRSCE